MAEKFSYKQDEQLSGNLELIMGLTWKTMTMKQKGTLSKMRATKFNALVNAGFFQNTPALVLE